jgi:molybdopterin converting factor small subunit
MQFHAAASPAPRNAIRVTVKLFAQYAELVGVPAVDVEIPAGGTVADAVARVREAHPGARQIPERPLAALNLAHVLPDHPLRDGDQLALLPPLAGG